MAMLADDRLHLGLDIWLKPLKFQVALAIFAFTMAVYARWLPAGTVGRRWHRLYVASVVGGDGGGDPVDLGRGGARHDLALQRDAGGDGVLRGGGGARGLVHRRDAGLWRADRAEPAAGVRPGAALRGWRWG